MLDDRLGDGAPPARLDAGIAATMPERDDDGDDGTAGQLQEACDLGGHEVAAQRPELLEHPALVEEIVTLLDRYLRRPARGGVRKRSRE